MGGLLWLIFLVLAFQGLFTFFQIQDFKKNAQELRKVGRIGVGNQKRKLRAGAIVILASDANKIVVDGRIVEGISVFAKFKPYTAYNGSKLINIISDIDNKLGTASNIDTARLIATKKAAQMILNTYDNAGETGAEEFTQIVEEEDIVDVVATPESDERLQNVYEEFPDFEESEEPEIIDVEEIKPID